MSEKNSEFTFDHSEQIDNIKIKRKIKTLSFQVEFNTLMNLLKDLKAMRTFMLRKCTEFALYIKMIKKST